MKKNYKEIYESLQLYLTEWTKHFVEQNSIKKSENVWQLRLDGSTEQGARQIDRLMAIAPLVEYLHKIHNINVFEHPTIEKRQSDSALQVHLAFLQTADKVLKEKTLSKE